MKIFLKYLLVIQRKIEINKSFSLYKTDRHLSVTDKSSETIYIINPRWWHSFADSKWWEYIGLNSNRGFLYFAFSPDYGVCFLCLNSRFLLVCLNPRCFLVLKSKIFVVEAVESKMFVVSCES